MWCKPALSLTHLLPGCLSCCLFYPQVACAIKSLDPGLSSYFAMHAVVKTSAADIFAQKVLEQREEIDWRRNAVFGGFGFAYLGLWQCAALRLRQMHGSVCLRLLLTLLPLCCHRLPVRPHLPRNPARGAGSGGRARGGSHPDLDRPGHPPPAHVFPRVLPDEGRNAGPARACVAAALPVGGRCPGARGAVLGSVAARGHTFHSLVFVMKCDTAFGTNTGSWAATGPAWAC